ncbi:FAA2 Long-chain-fatty-acid--CoA ligase 2 [Candida maltosa Xu316]
MSSSIFNSPQYTRQSAVGQLPLGRNVTKAVELKGTRKDGSSNIFRNKAVVDHLIANIHPDLNTHHKLFNNAAELYADRPCLGKRPYDYHTHKSEDRFEYLTYAEVKAKKDNIGAGFIRCLLANPFLDPSLESHRKVVNHLRDWPTFGINKTARENTDCEIEKNASFILTLFAVNRMEWVLTDLACSSFSITNTALYDTLGPDVSQYILELTQSPIVKYPQQTKSVISIVSMDPIDLVSQGTIEEAYELGVSILDLEQVEKMGKEDPINELPPNPDTLFTVSFTSGTTGNRPKGVMVHHGCAAAYISALMTYEPQAQPGERAFIFLPLTHLYERQTSGFAVCSGYYLGFPQTNLGHSNINAFNSMIADLKIFQPTYMSIVPRLLTRLEAFIKSKIKELPEREQQKVNHIIKYKMKQQSKRDGATGANSEYDSYPPYKALRELVGYQKLKWTQTASAPVAPTTLVYLKAALSIGVRQQYGLTESGAAITSTGDYEAVPGSCGSIAPTGDLKLGSASEMGYDIKKLEGEVLLRGPQMFKGYYYNYEETDKSINEDGWFHSGDVARIDPKTGRLTIVDRVKHFFKLSQGEYISPERIENRYLSSNPQISQLFVSGRSTESFLVAIVGVEYEKGLIFLNEEFGYNKIDMESHELLEILNRSDVKAKFLQKMNHAVRDKLNGFERLHNIFIEHEPLTVKREVVTPTMKIRRPIAAKFFKNEIDLMYTQGSLLDYNKHKL